MATATKSTRTITIAGRELALSNIDKVLYPGDGFTKGHVVDYYERIAEFMLPHLKGRSLTLKRYPNGTDPAAMFFYEKRCPKHKPDWINTIDIPYETKDEEINYCTVDSAAGLAWTANLASIELHVLLSKAPR